MNARPDVAVTVPAGSETLTAEAAAELRAYVHTLENAVALRTLERDAAREYLNAEAHRFAVQAGEDRETIRVLAKRLARELTP